MDFIIATIKKLGWHRCSLRSKHTFITLNEHGPYWLHATDGWRNLTTKCMLRTVGSAFLWTISPGIQSIMNQQTCSWNFSNQTWPICATMWRWHHSLSQGTLSLWILPSSSWAWRCRWTQHIQDQSSWRDDDGSVCMEPSFIANDCKLLESHGDSTVSATFLVFSMHWIWYRDPTSIPPHADPAAWAILREFAATDMRLPDAEQHIKDVLRSCYTEADWQAAFKAVMNAKNDSDTATSAIEKLAHAAANRTEIKICLPARPVVPQLDDLKNDLTQSISDLQGQNHIFGTSLTLDEFLEPKEEAETWGSATAAIFYGPEGDKAIVAEVVWEIMEKNNKVIEVESDNEDEPRKPDVSCSDTINLCEKLIEACLQHGNTSSDLTLDLLTHLHCLCVYLHQEELLHSQQTTLDIFLTCSSHQSLNLHTYVAMCYILWLSHLSQYVTDMILNISHNAWTFLSLDHMQYEIVYCTCYARFTLPLYYLPYPGIKLPTSLRYWSLPITTLLILSIAPGLDSRTALWLSTSCLSHGKPFTMYITQPCI